MGLEGLAIRGAAVFVCERPSHLLVISLLFIGLIINQAVSD